MADGMFVYIVGLLVIFISFSEKLVSGYNEKITVYTFYKELWVSQFRNFGSLQLFDIDAPPKTLSLMFEICGQRNKAKCPVQNILLYWQYGSIPAAEYQGNMTYPPDFDLQRSYLDSLTIPANGSQFLIHLDSPLTGTWFLVAVVEENTNQVIKKITDDDCSYSIQMNVTTSVLSSVLEVGIGTLFTLGVLPDQNLYRFYVDGDVYKYSVILSCNNILCPLILSARGGGLPTDHDDTQSVNCSSSSVDLSMSACTLDVVSPLIDQWHYLRIDNFGNNTLNVGLLVNFSGCSSSDSSDYSESTSAATTQPTVTSVLSYVTNLVTSSLVNLSTSISTTPINQIIGDDVGSTIMISNEILDRSGNVDHRTKRNYKQTTMTFPSCLPAARFSQIVDTSSPFLTLFILQPMFAPAMIFAAGDVPYITRFDLHVVKDIGGTLKIAAELLFPFTNFPTQNDSQENVSMMVCIQRGSLPIGSDLNLRCSDDGNYVVLTPRNTTYLRWFPFPEPGPWFIGVQRICFNDSTDEAVHCQKMGIVTLDISTSPCASESCENTGYCVEYQKNFYTYAACQCNAGYRGFLCDDGTLAPSDDIQMMYSFILSMSNLFFIPAIGIACWRRRFTEAVVYLSNMFFSSFYHACDMSAWSKYTLCIMPYNVLSFCDFFCSMLSFWVTLVAVARLPFFLASIAHMAGAVALAMAVKWDMHSIVANAVPIAIGVAIVITSWVVRCCKKKELYPRKKSLLWILPGFVLAGFGICLFAFVETDANYPYTHSVWHVCMAISVVFLLPRSKVQIKDDANNDNTSFQLEEFNDVSQLISADFNNIP